MPRLHLLCSAAIVPRAYRNAAVAPCDVDPQVPGGGVPNRVRDDLLNAAQNSMRANRIINRQIFGDHKMHVRRWNACNKRSQCLRKSNRIFSPQYADDAAEVG